MVPYCRTNGIDVGDDQILKPLNSDSAARIRSIEPDRSCGQQLRTVITDQIDREMYDREYFPSSRVTKLSREPL